MSGLPTLMQGAWAVLVGNGHHWRVLKGELLGNGLNEVRQERTVASEDALEKFQRRGTGEQN